jgi:hypothetical protein
MIFDGTQGTSPVTTWKNIAQLASYAVGIVATVLAVWTYRSNSRRERAKWAVQLYEKFYETELYKEMRDQLDCAPESEEVGKIVKAESFAFTDFLGFFELVAVLVDNKQLSKKDVLDLFDYYLGCLRRHSAVAVYIDDPAHGFEHLSRFLRETRT